MTIFPEQPSLGRTLSDWVDQLQREYLDRRERIELDRLNAAITTTDTVLTVSFAAAGVRPQAQIEIDDELCHIWSEGPAGPPDFEVQRGVGGSTSASHAANAIIRVGPRWPRIVLANQLAREVRSWPLNIFAVAAGDLEVAASTSAIDLDVYDVEVVRLLRVQRPHPNTSNESWPTMHARLERNQDLATFPSGYGLRLLESPARAMTLRVALAYRPVVPRTIDFTDDLGSVWHLNHALADAAMLGVAARLLMADETDRTDDRAQPRPRRAEDVPPGHRLQAGQALMIERDRLLRMEAERLAAMYGPGF